jgi:hypothetical protein
VTNYYSLAAVVDRRRLAAAENGFEGEREKGKGRWEKKTRAPVSKHA